MRPFAYLALLILLATNCAAEDSFTVTVLSAGPAGPAIAPGDRVTVRYQTKTAAGEAIAGYGEDSPFEFVAGSTAIIPAWRDGLIGLTKGTKVRMDVSASAAYGERGSALVPPNTALVFEIEILEVTPQSEENWRISSQGMRILDLQAGNQEGDTVQAGCRVEAHYTGWLLDLDAGGAPVLTSAREFDSSLDRSKSFSFTVGRGEVIRGWDLGVIGMHAGGRRKLVIPPELAYGARGAGATIPPHATLLFEIQVLGIEAQNLDDPTELPEERTVTTPTGLAYVILREGHGEKIRAGQSVLCHYRGMLDSGHEFGSSEKDGRPLQIRVAVGQLVPGWEEALQDMRAGETRRLRLPPHLGYGARGRGRDIPPNSTLYFDIEVLQVLD